MLLYLETSGSCTGHSGTTKDVVALSGVCSTCRNTLPTCPRGSKYPICKVSGFKYHTFWNQKPLILGTSTLLTASAVESSDLPLLGQARLTSCSTPLGWGRPYLQRTWDFCFSKPWISPSPCRSFALASARSASKSGAFIYVLLMTLTSAYWAYFFFGIGRKIRGSILSSGPPCEAFQWAPARMETAMQLQMLGGGVPQTFESALSCLQACSPSSTIGVLYSIQHTWKSQSISSLGAYSSNPLLGFCKSRDRKVQVDSRQKAQLSSILAVRLGSKSRDQVSGSGPSGALLYLATPGHRGFPK